MRKKTENRIENPVALWAVAILFVGVFFLAGAFLTYYRGIRYVSQNNQVKQSWEKVPCKILSVELEKVKRKTTGGPRVGIGRRTRSRGSRGSSTTYLFRVKAEYIYQYQGKQYTGDTCGFQDTLSSKFHKMMSKHIYAIRSQENPVCFVNPDNPEEAILEPMLNPASMIVSGAGVLLMLIGIAAAFKFRPYLIKKDGAEKSAAKK